jgi:hypothetical protein
MLDVEELLMTKAQYKVFEALNPFFGGRHGRHTGTRRRQTLFRHFAEDAIFESRYHFPIWPSMIRGRANLMASFSGYGKTIKLHSGDALVVHHSRNPVSFTLPHLVMQSVGAPIRRLPNL